MHWRGEGNATGLYNVYRADEVADALLLSDLPVADQVFHDRTLSPGSTAVNYWVRSLGANGCESAPLPTAEVLVRAHSRGK